MSSLPTRLLALTAAVFVAAAAQATVITDGFDDGTRDNSVDGVNWYGINGTTSSGKLKPGLTVVDDSAGIGSGNALEVEAVGSNSEAIAVLGQPVSLGANVGDKVVLSFDFRLLVNLGGDLRFGIYEDTDVELGTGGWGTSDGDFDAESPGAFGDTGFFLRLPLLANADGARIQDEANQNNILGGSGDADFIARPDPGTFTGVTDTLKHSVRFTVERTGAGVNDLVSTLELDNQSFGGSDSNDTIVSVTTFDYFVATTTTDTDWVIDNFRLESIAIPEPTALGLVGVGVTAWRRRNRR